MFWLNHSCVLRQFLGKMIHSWHFPMFSIQSTIVSQCPQSCEISILLHGAKPNFTRRKTLKLRQDWHLHLKNICWPSYQIRLVYTQNLVQIFSKHAWSCQIVCSSRLLPQPVNIFTRIYPSYPWHFATLNVLQRYFLKVKFLMLQFWICSHNV